MITYYIQLIGNSQPLINYLEVKMYAILIVHNNSCSLAQNMQVGEYIMSFNLWAAW